MIFGFRRAHTMEAHGSRSASPHTCIRTQRMAATQGSLAEALSLVTSTPYEHFVRGCPEATSSALRLALELFFEQSVRANTSLGKRLLRGRPLRLRSGALNTDQLWLMVEEHNRPIVTWVEATAAALVQAQDLVTLDAVGPAPRADAESVDDGAADDVEDNDDDDNDDAPSGQENEDEEAEERDYEADSLLDDDTFKMGAMEAFAEQLEHDEFDGDEKESTKGDEDADSYASSASSTGSYAVMYNPLEDDGDVTYEDFFVPRAAGAASRLAAAANKQQPAKTTSKFRRERAELAQRIAELEEAATAEKPWMLKGESMARQRPTDSLLQAGDLDVAYQRRAAPELTKEAAEQIDDVIKRRIAEAQFDDLVPRDANGVPAAPVEAVLSTQQSKDGLGDVYAKDYEERVLRHVPQAQAERSKEHVEVRAMFDQVVRKLDALSNFFFTPKPPPTPNNNNNKAPDVPAALMEEVTPFTQAGGTAMAAPEQKRAPLVGLGKSRDELEPAEKQAQRNASKNARRKRKAADGAPHDKDTAKATRKPFKKLKEAKSDIKWSNSADVFAHLTQA